MTLERAKALKLAHEMLDAWPLNPLLDKVQKIVLALIASESEKDRMRQALEVLDELRKLLLDQPWHQRCEIIPDYMPPYPSKDTRQTIQVRYNNGAEYPPFLRYSKGPKQGFFWDVYGDHLHSEALALMAIHQAPAPVDVGPIVVSLPIKSLKEDSHD